MTNALLKNDMEGAFGHVNEKSAPEDLGQYSVDFREVIVPDDFVRREERNRVCSLKIDFHGSGAPKGGAQMFINLDRYDVEELLPAINEAYKKLLKWLDANPSMTECWKCKGNGFKDGDEKANSLLKCEVCSGTGKILINPERKG